MWIKSGFLLKKIHLPTVTSCHFIALSAALLVHLTLAINANLGTSHIFHKSMQFLSGTSKDFGTHRFQHPCGVPEPSTDKDSITIATTTIYPAVLYNAMQVVPSSITGTLCPMISAVQLPTKPLTLPTDTELTLECVPSTAIQEPAAILGLKVTRSCLALSETIDLVQW